MHSSTLSKHLYSATIKVEQLCMKGLLKVPHTATNAIYSTALHGDCSTNCLPILCVCTEVSEYSVYWDIYIASFEPHKGKTSLWFQLSNKVKCFFSLVRYCKCKRHNDILTLYMYNIIVFSLRMIKENYCKTYFATSAN